MFILFHLINIVYDEDPHQILNKSWKYWSTNLQQLKQTCMNTINEIYELCPICNPIIKYSMNIEYLCESNISDFVHLCKHTDNYVTKRYTYACDIMFKYIDALPAIFTQSNLTRSHT